MEKPKVDAYRKLSERVLEGNKRKVFENEYFELITQLLEWNPELYTVWNYRKEFLMKFIDKCGSDEEKHEILTKELYFVLKQLKRFPKSYWIWNHRMWCLKLDKMSDWQTELKFIQQFLSVDSRNYHVWSYRRFIIQCMKNDVNVKDDDEVIDFDEFKFTTGMINKDISNYSAWHNRSKLVEMLFHKSPELNESGEMGEYLLIFNGKDMVGFLKKELMLFKTAIYTDADDSSVWFYMKWLISDYFMRNIERDVQLEIVGKLMDDIRELNELEVEDNGVDNKWCLISIVYLLERVFTIRKEDGEVEEFRNCLDKLQVLDPMKKERYVEMMAKHSILP